MPKQIYNEGRVVGLSAYEVYVRQHLQEDPGTPPASEKEWLAASIGGGASMILKVGADTSKTDDQVYYKDFKLPSGSRLCAANTIVASFFTGDAQFSTSSNFAIRVNDYGQLLSNTSANHPEGKYTYGTITNIPVKTMTDWSQSMKDGLASYVSIVDGMVIQPGEWSKSDFNLPYQDLEPNWGESGLVRLQFKGPIEHSFCILLTGFTSRGIIAGVTGVDSGSTNSPFPNDGDFLGPAVFPWGSKIIFSFPTSAANFLFKSGYKRKIPSTTGEEKVGSSTVIVDMASTDPHDYYSDEYSDAPIPVDVTDINMLGKYASVLTIYEKALVDESVNLPPAIYASKVSENGITFLNPIDTVAPGTLKMFGEQEAISESKAKTVQQSFPGNFAFFKKPSGNNVVYQLRSDITVVPVAKTSTESLTHSKTSTSNASATYTDVTTGDVTTKSISLQKSDGTLYTLNLATAASKTIGSGSSQSAGGTTIPNNNQLGKGSRDGYIAWGELLEALANDARVDLYTPQLRSMAYCLPNIVTSGVLRLEGTSESSVGGKFSAGGTVKSGKEYMEFTQNGTTKRLYICSNEPTGSDIPEGSIGIGWGMD